MDWEVLWKEWESARSDVCDNTYYCMDLAETLTEVPVPYSQYIEYQRLEVQVAGLQQQVAELTARA